MNQLEPASYGRRIAAFLINLVIGLLLTKVSKYAPIDPEEINHLTYFIGLIYVIVFTLLPESPGKRILNMKTLSDKKEPITFKRRLVRNSVYLTFFTIASLFYFLPPIDLEANKDAVFLLIPSHFVIPLFMASNAFTVLMQPQGLSLIDMRTKTQTFGTPKPQGWKKNSGMLKPY